MILRKGVSGLGMYPDETCFDVTRPSWLPYWLDDLSESACKINELVSGNVTGNTTAASQLGADLTTVQNTQQACLDAGGSWDDASNICTPGILGTYGTWVLAGAAALIGLIFVTRK